MPPMTSSTPIGLRSPPHRDAAAMARAIVRGSPAANEDPVAAARQALTGANQGHHFAMKASAAMRAFIAMVDPLRIVGLALSMLAWQAASLLFQPIILPPPLAVMNRLLTDFWDAPALSYFGVAEANLYANLIYTAQNVAIAVSAGAAIGIVSGLVSARFSIFRAIADPIMTTVGTVPILVAAPFLLIWFGVGRASAVCLVVFYVTVIMYLYAQKSARNLDPIYEDFARTLGATPRRVVIDLLLPATVPEILGGLRIALAGAWGLEAVSELLGSQQGIGKVLEVLAGATDPEGIMANLLLLGLVAILVDGALALAVARFATWNAGLNSAGGKR
jgi:ABC-type nitrate/sulfonate/bicarbonate transport system permease component